MPLFILGFQKKAAVTILTGGRDLSHEMAMSLGMKDLRMKPDEYRGRYLLSLGGPFE